MKESIFRKWPKIPRTNPFRATITEKIDGTNSCIIIEEAITGSISSLQIVGIQSRNRLITPDDDNFGFAKWVRCNESELIKLGRGHHFGEWAGPGIQNNPHNLTEKTFFLFNTKRWSIQETPPSCCSVVPILFDGILGESTIEDVLNELAGKTSLTYKPEGIVVYYHTMNAYTKHTINSPDGKWCKE